MKNPDKFIAAFGGLNFEDGQSAPNEFMFAPGGLHVVTGSRVSGDGSEAPTRVYIQIDAQTASRMNEVLNAYQARGTKPYFDFNHAEAEAAAWPESFFWKDGQKPGVYVKCSWSKPGNEAIVGRTWRTFSPSFHPDKWISSEKSPAKMIGAPLVMGGLVNDPAFKKIASFWTRNSKLNLMQTDTQQQTDSIETRLEKAESTLKTRNAEIADAAIKRAQSRGALATVPEEGSPQDKLVCKWRADIENDPDQADILDSVPGVIDVSRPWMTTASHRRGESVVMGDMDITHTLKTYMKARTTDHPIYSYFNERNASRMLSDELKSPHIYSRGIRKLMGNKESAQAVMRCARQLDYMQGANAIGLLAGVLVVQRRLDLMKWEFPEIARVTTDFSASPVNYNQQITTRIVAPQAAGRYDAVAGYVSQSVADTDVNVTINQHGFVQFTFTANDLAATTRLLFPEQEEGMHFSMGLDLVSNLLALITPGNFPGQVGDNTATPTGATVPGITKAQLDQMGRNVVIALKTALNQRGATGGNRTLLLNELYHAALEGDTTIVGNIVNPDSGHAISTSRLPIISGFQPYESPYLPAANNLVGVGFRQDALVMASRLPNDYANVFPGVTGGGVTQIVTNPDTGLSVTLTMFLDHQKGWTSMRLAYMFGVAVGNPRAAQLLVSK